MDQPVLSNPFLKKHSIPMGAWVQHRQGYLADKLVAGRVIGEKYDPQNGKRLLHVSWDREQTVLSHWETCLKQITVDQANDLISERVREEQQYNTKGQRKKDKRVKILRAQLAEVNTELTSLNHQLREIYSKLNNLRARTFTDDEGWG